jgi:hypothetical protein
MRLGELAALRWADVHLLEGEIVVARTYTPGVGETPTKDGEPRTVDLTPQAMRVLEEWYRQMGGDGLVFQREIGGYIDGGQVLGVLYAAMNDAGIPRESERGGKRTFHSLRNTFARIALEAAAPSVAWNPRPARRPITGEAPWTVRCGHLSVPHAVRNHSHLPGPRAGKQPDRERAVRPAPRPRPPTSQRRRACPALDR